MALFTTTLRITIEGTIEVEADDEEAAFKVFENLDYITAMNDIDVEFDEVEVLGEVEEIPSEDEEEE